MRRVSALFLLAAGVLGAGSLQGPVRLLEKDGRARASLKDVIAILEPRAKVPSPPRPLLRIKTAGKRFIPRVAWTTPGSEVSFPNQDSILHNVFSVCCANPFDTGHYEPGESPRTKVHGVGLMKLYCNVHHKMNAFLWVVETPWAQVLDGRSGLDFQDLPPGAYTLRLWHPESGERRFAVSIGEGATHGDWTLGATLPAFEPHKNKFGKDYPPAKDEGYY